jgi:hypothetical protein
MYEYACVFVINFCNFFMIGILYNALRCNIEFDQAYCKDLLKRVIRKFILHFCDMYSIFYELLTFHEFQEIFKSENDFEID